MPEKILIIGKGFLGNTIFKNASEMGFQCIATSFNSEPRLDICNFDLINKYISVFAPDYIINCAALTNVDKIETSPEMAYAVNSNGAKNIAMAAKKIDAVLVHISTDSVFDGKGSLYNEEDIPHPINEYSKSKKLGEDFVNQFSNKFIIVRTNFYGYNSTGKFLFNWILDNLKNKIKFTAFSNVIFNPLEINNLSQMILELLHSNYYGLLHLSTDKMMSKFEFAKIVANSLNYNEKLVAKGKIEDSNLMAKRPLNTTLANNKVKRFLRTKPISLNYWLENIFVKSKFH